MSLISEAYQSHMITCHPIYFPHLDQFTLKDYFVALIEINPETAYFNQGIFPRSNIPRAPFFETILFCDPLLALNAFSAKKFAKHLKKVKRDKLANIDIFKSKCTPLHLCQLL